MCHVFAGGQRVATFEPSGQFCTWLYQHPWLSKPYDAVVACLNWPFKEGRTPLTATLIPLLGILCASVGSRWRATLRRGRETVILSEAKNLKRYIFGSSLRRRHSRLSLQSYSFWQQFISVFLIVALFLAVTPTEVRAATCSPVFWYYHGDHLGSSSIMTDRQGNLVKHYEYTAFGRERFNGGCAFNVSHRYTGQTFDEETGLYYYNARYYDPELGRFIQPDTLVPTAADPQGLNRYSYCHNNPLNATDPSGHMDPVMAVIVLIVVAVVVAWGSGLRERRPESRFAELGAAAFF